jgi:cytidylate kinase-like protein
VIRIVTIEREYGAGGAVIAEKLAARLNWKLWDQALTEEIARQAHVDRGSVERLEERVDPLFYRLMKVFMRGSYERSLPVENLEYLDCEKLVPFMTRVIEGVAAAGNCVIVGRGAPYVLRARDDAFHVFVYAPQDEKIKTYFGKDWPTREFYHLMINSKVGDELVVRTVLGETSRL